MQNIKSTYGYVVGEAKAQHELSIFRSFMKTAGLGGKPVNQKPPSPDILLKGACGKDRAFELGEIVDEHFAREIKSGGYIRFSDPVRSLLRKKFGKKYQSDVPIDLIIYAYKCPMLPNNTWIDEVNSVIGSNCNRQIFDHLYMFDPRTRTIAYDRSL